MKTFKNILVLFVGFLFINVAVASDFISATDVVQLLKDKNVVLVSAQKPSLYSNYHITGSINLPPAILTTDDPIPYVNLPIEEMAKIIGGKGIANTNKIIVYDEGSSKYSGRLYWVFKYLGVEDVKILDGGIESWKAIRKPVTATPTKLKATTFTPNVQSKYMADLSEVKKATSDPNYVIIDARSESEYNGTDDTDLRKGHIPNAIHIEYTNVLAADGKIKSADQLRSMFESYGVTPDKTIIVYCKTSVRAAIEFAALSSVLDFQNVKVFDGAFCEWCKDKSTEVVL